MKKRLVILSDLWGKESASWLQPYENYLKTHFKVAVYYSPELAEIDPGGQTKEERHKQMIIGGIDVAVQNLIVLEKQPIDILAFSIGGIIAWKFALQSPLPTSITCVSSTRLRLEIDRPGTDITLYFGSNDTYIPKPSWFKKMNLNPEIIKDQPHEFYTSLEFTKQICAALTT